MTGRFIIFGALVSTGVLAAPPDKAKAPAPAKTSVKTPPPDEEPAEDEAEKKSNHYKSLSKVRPGSVLKNAEPEPPAPDLRGLIERRRDWEVVAHFQRLAELDVITELAIKNNDGSLADRAEAVRRLEIERFRLAMRRLRNVIQAKALTGVQ
jgi:hypothetical protein